MFGYILVSNTGAKYIGITTDVSRRLREHRSSGPMSKTQFQLEEKFKFKNREEASVWEITEINRLGIENILNTSLGGFGGRKRVCTEGERKVLSEKAKLRYQNPEYRMRMSEALKKAWSSEDARAKQSLVAKETCAKESTKIARSDSQKTSWLDPEIRERRLIALRANRNDPMKKEMRSEAALKMWEKRRSKV